MQATKISFKKMAVEYRDNSEMFDAVVGALDSLADAAIASEIGD